MERRFIDLANCDDDDDDEVVDDEEKLAKDTRKSSKLLQNSSNIFIIHKMADKMKTFTLKV